MPTVPVPNTAEVQWLWGSGPQQVRFFTSFYVQNATVPWTPTKLSALCSAMTTRWNNLIAPIVHSNILMFGSRARDLGTTPYGPYITVPANLTGGLAPGDDFPYFCCGVIRIIGAPGGQPARSYIRHAGIREDQASGNTLNVTGLADLNSSYTLVYAGTQTHADDRTVIVSRVDGGVPRPAGVTNGIQATMAALALGRAVSRSGLRP